MAYKQGANILRVNNLSLENTHGGGQTIGVPPQGEFFPSRSITTKLKN